MPPSSTVPNAIVQRPSLNARLRAARRRLAVGPVLGANVNESAIARRIRLLLDDVEFGAQPAGRARVGLFTFVAALLIVGAVRLGVMNTGGNPAEGHDYAARHAEH